MNAGNFEALASWMSRTASCGAVGSRHRRAALVRIVLAVLLAVAGGLVGCSDSDSDDADTAAEEGTEDNTESEESPEEGDEANEETAEPQCDPDDRGFCESCECDNECGPNGRCVIIAGLEPFCSKGCSVTDSDEDCEPGTFCGQYGNTTSEFACVPQGGTCNGDGQQCSLCEADDDCGEGFVCHESSRTNAMDCFQTCSADGDCPGDLVCETFDGQSLCVPLIQSQNVGAEPVARDVCNVNARAFCEPCTFNYQCEQGLSCVGKVCTTECVAEAGLESNCPEGLFCNGGFCRGTEAVTCQNWLVCGAANVCATQEVCVKGFCKRPCDVGCNPVQQECIDGFCEDI